MLDIEKEVFSDCGAWKNFLDLEESLTLEELGELYDIAVEKQNRFIKMMGAMQGVEFEEPSNVYSKKGEDDWMKPTNERYLITPGAQELEDFQYGLGYELKTP